MSPSDYESNMIIILDGFNFIKNLLCIYFNDDLTSSLNLILIGRVVMQKRKICF